MSRVLCLISCSLSFLQNCRTPHFISAAAWRKKSQNAKETAMLGGRIFRLRQVFLSPPKPFLIFQGGPFLEWWSSEVMTWSASRAEGCARDWARLQRRKDTYVWSWGTVLLQKNEWLLLSHTYWGRSRGMPVPHANEYLYFNTKNWELGQMQERSVVFFNQLNILMKNVLLGIPETMTKPTYSLSTRPPKRRNWFHITFHTSFILPPPEKGPHTMTQKTSVLFTAHLLVSLCPVELQESKPVWEPGGLRLFSEACPGDAGTVNHAWQTIVVRGAFVLFCFSGVVLVFPWDGFVVLEQRWVLGGWERGTGDMCTTAWGGSVGTGPAAWQNALNVHIPFFVFFPDYPLALNMLMSLAPPSAVGQELR